MCSRTETSPSFGDHGCAERGGNLRRSVIRTVIHHNRPESGRQTFKHPRQSFRLIQAWEYHIYFVAHVLTLERSVLGRTAPIYPASKLIVVTTSDLLSIVAIAGACALFVGAIGAGTLRLLRRKSIVVQTAIVAIGAVAATLSGITGVAAAMFLSAHDFTVVAYVCAISGLIATLLSLELSRRIVHASHELTSATRRLGEGSETMLADSSHGSELSGLAGELSTASAKLSRARKRERTMETSRRELIAWISHDLRAPLTSLLTSIEALEDDRVADVSRAHKQLRVEVDRVADMVDDLFELSHAQAENPQPSRRHVALYDVVSEAISNVGPVARARAIQIEGFDISSVTVYIDDRRMARALSSILLTAIRHTPPEGTVTVSASSGNNGHATVQITDSCGGTQPADLNHVFDTAWRGDSSASTTGPHTAANQSTVVKSPTVLKGMATVKDSVEAGGGAIAVSSVSSGCRFEVTLPLALEPLALDPLAGEPLAAAAEDNAT